MTRQSFSRMLSQGVSIMIASFMLFAVSSTVSFAGTETTLHGFNTMPNGSAPVGNMVADSAGNLYGATAQGGAWGVVFKLTPTKSGGWTETVIHDFTNSPDGAYPGGSLIFDPSGNLYGVTGGGGTYGLGTVFKLTANGKGWTETILVNFSFANGSYPNSLIFDKAGNLFGTTYRGGSGRCYSYDGQTNYGCGVVFELSPQSNGSWTDKVLYNFNDSDTNNADPGGPLVFDKAGNLYGAASGFDSQCGNSFDCPYGEIFELSPSQGGTWTQSVVYSFENTTASFPGTLAIDSTGNLYGSALGGTSYSGILFELSPPTVSGGSWTENVLYNFQGPAASDGSYPSSLILDAAGNIYGTTEFGGLTGYVCADYGYGCGTIFELSPNGSGGWNETILYVFTNGNDGGLPNGIYRDASGNLYTSEWGGPVCGVQSLIGCGSILKLSSSNGVWTPAVLYDFTSVVDGYQPRAGLLADSLGNYYGTTSNGGAYNRGTVFKVNKNSSGTWHSSILYSFGNSKTDAQTPMGGLIFDSRGNLYGTTESGGANSGGTVYELSPSAQGTWTETILYSFPSYSTTNACSPTSSLALDSVGNLYGIAGCGTGSLGTVFELSPQAGGWVESVLHSFAGSNDGWYPNGPVILDKKGNLYGVTYQGYGASGSGQYLDGVVYELSPPANGGGAWTETLLLTFPGGSKGAYASGSLVFDNAGNLYGTTEQGGSYNSGIVYKLSSSGTAWTETVLHSFKGVDNDGGWPIAGVTLDSTGALWGTTEYGGRFSYSCLLGCGIVFKLTESSGGQWQESVLYRFTGGLDGMEPSAPVILDSAGNLYGTTPYAGSGAGGTVFKIKP